MNTIQKTYLKRPFLFILALLFVFSGVVEARAQTVNIGGNPEVLVCDVLASLGLGCGETAAPDTNDLAGNGNGSGSDVESKISGNRSSGGALLQASISSSAVKRNGSSDRVILVKIPAGGGAQTTFGLTTDDALFEIINGQRHFISTADIFFDYGFNFNSVQSISREELEKFPQAKLVKVSGKGDDVYYITDGFMIRLIPDRKVFDSYGNREEDIITISKKEFNFYPRNQFVYVENPFTGDVFQVTGDGIKRYVVPQALKRMRITIDQIAPINKIQLDSYAYGAPIIY